VSWGLRKSKRKQAPTQEAILSSKVGRNKKTKQNKTRKAQDLRRLRVTQMGMWNRKGKKSSQKHGGTHYTHTHTHTNLESEEEVDSSRRRKRRAAN
jgi:hypothetical protein